MLTAAWVTRKLQYQIGQAQPEDIILRLFINDHAPHPRDAAEVYAEPIDGGYRAVRLKPADWTIEPAAPGRAAVAKHPEVIWTFLGGQKFIVYGCFFTLQDSGLLVGADRFDSPRWVEYMGDQEKVFPVLVGGI